MPYIKTVLTPKRNARSMPLDLNDNYTNSALRVGAVDPDPARRVGEFIGIVVSNEWVNDEYKHLVLKVHERALKAYAGQMFHLLCPSPDSAEVWMRRPMSVYRVDAASGEVEFLYKSEGRGTRGMATLQPGDEFNIAGPLGVGFKLQPAWKNIVVLGRGVGLATLAPLSQLAAAQGVGVTAILSARHEGVVMSKALFEGLGARTITVLDSDGSSAVENVERILEALIAAGNADAFFTCGSNRLLKLMQRLGKKHNIAGQVAMEQIMVCGFGACYVCVRTFEIDGKRVLKRVCRDGPVFNMQEAVGW
jgi:dihydroorotate dehydrogenase electron transfer subunit